MSGHSTQIIVGGAFLALGAFVVIRLLLTPWIIERDVDRMIRDIAAGHPLPKTPSRDWRFHITFDSVGFTVTDSRTSDQASIRMTWAEVVQVIAFKQDLFTVDRMCLSFSRADETGIHLHEHMQGWLAFCEALPGFLPGCRHFHDWLWPVSTPAFSVNLTEIYSRATNGTV